MNRFCSDRVRDGEIEFRFFIFKNPCRPMSTRCLDKAEGVESPRAHAMLSRRSQAEPKSREWVSARTVVLPAIDPEQSLNLSCDIFLNFFLVFFDATFQ